MTIKVKVITLFSLLFSFYLFVYLFIYGQRSSLGIIESHISFFPVFLQNSGSALVDFSSLTSLSLKEPNTNIVITNIASGQYNRQDKTQHSLVSFTLSYPGLDVGNSGLFLSGYGLRIDSHTGSFFDVKHIELNSGNHLVFKDQTISGFIEKFQSKSFLSQQKLYIGKPLMLIDNLGSFISHLSGQASLLSGFFFEDSQRTFLVGLSLSTGSLIVNDKSGIYKETMTRNIASKEISYVVLDKITDESLTISGKISTIHENTSSIGLIFTGTLLYDFLGVKYSKNQQGIFYSINSQLLYK